VWWEEEGAKGDGHWAADQLPGLGNYRLFATLVGMVQKRGQIGVPHLTKDGQTVRWRSMASAVLLAVPWICHAMETEGHVCIRKQKVATNAAQRTPLDQKSFLRGGESAGLNILTHHDHNGKLVPRSHLSLPQRCACKAGIVFCSEQQPTLFDSMYEHHPPTLGNYTASPHRC